MKKLLSLILVITLVACFFAGCSGSEEPVAPAAPAENGAAAAPVAPAAPAAGTLQSKISPDEEYIVVNCLNNIEYFNAHKYGWEKAGELFGVKVSFTGPADDDINAMVSAFETAMAKEPAGICVWGYDAALDSYIVKAQEAGIPVVTFVGFSGETGDTYIGTSQYDIGYEGAKLYADLIGGQGEVAILTITGSAMFEERQRGFEDGFAEYPGIKLVAVGDTKADSALAISTAKDIAIKYENLNGFVCCDSTGASGAATALAELGLTGKVDVLGLDRNSDVLNMVKDGTITGTIAQNDVSMPYWAMVCLITQNHVEIPLAGDNAAVGAKVTPNYIYTSVNLITAETVDSYLDANELYATNGF